MNGPLQKPRDTKTELEGDALSAWVVEPQRLSWNRWIEPARLFESWLPGYFSPSFDSVDAALLTRNERFVQIRDLVELPADAKHAQRGDCSATWIALVDGNAIHVRPFSAATDSELLKRSVPLPLRALLLLWNQLSGLRLELWEPELYDGTCVADLALVQLLEKPENDLAWIASELRSNPLLRAQIQRAELSNPEAGITTSTILDLRLERPDPTHIRIAGSRFRANELARRLLVENVGRKGGELTEPREFLLTGATIDERLAQFEQYVLAEPWFEGQHGFVLSGDGLADSLVLRALRNDGPRPSDSRTSIIRNESVAPHSSRWNEWLDDLSSDYHIFNSLLGGDDLPDGLWKDLVRHLGVRSPLPPFRIWRQLYQEVWNVREGIGPADWDYLTRVLDRVTHVNDPHASADPGASFATPSAIQQLRTAYSPFLALKAGLEDGTVRTYILKGPDQADAPLAAHIFSERAARNLANALGRSVRFSAEAARRESLRRSGWIMHNLAGPLANGNQALEDLERFASRNPNVADALVPDDWTAHERARMPGRELTEFTVAARIGLLQQALHQIKVFTSRIRRFRHIVSLRELPVIRIRIGPLISNAMIRFGAGYPEVELDIKRDVAESHLEVSGNESLLLEALDEVLANSGRELRVRSIPHAAITILLETSESNVNIRIRDNALPAQVALVPRPFEEGTSGYHRTGEGSGLGLAMVKEILSKHSGRCELIPNYDTNGNRTDGVTFVATLPLTVD
jgi:signal transduction histidine kinase